MRSALQLSFLVITGILLIIAGLAFNQVRQQIPELGPISLADSLSQLEDAREVLTANPLLGSMEAAGTTLTVAGVLTETNTHRATNDLPAFASNTTLNQAAQNKLDDMFQQQYFDHVSPDGFGPADVVDNVAYTYVRVGENLALGNFDGDAALVQAWMNSPGHRANILHTGFSELGVAVGEGIYQGEQTWLAVQTFAKPL